MPFEEYVVVGHDELVSGVYSLRLAPKSGQPHFQFIAGQFCQLKNPTSDRPDDARSFSIASSPNTKEYIEFCFKVYGPWTQALAKKQIGESVLLAGPLGRFTFDASTDSAVFLAGGVGIAPLLSMLRYINEQHIGAHITLIYGNRTEESIAYRQEIESIVNQLPNAKVVHVLSDIPVDSPWPGYKGFVTKEIITKEADLATNPTFFLCGPPVFVQLMKDVLKQLNVDSTRVKQEIYSTPPPPRAPSGQQAPAPMPSPQPSADLKAIQANPPANETPTVPQTNPVEAFVQSHPSWKVENNTLLKTFELPGFIRAIEFVNTIAPIAEQYNHHPDIFIRYNKVMIGLTSHDAGNIVTDKDVAVASAIESSAVTK